MSSPSNPLLNALQATTPVVSVELRPPRAELDAAAGMDAWIDTHHAVRGLVRGGTFVFLTDSAVGAREEHTLRHLVSNLGHRRAPQPRRAVPDLETHTRVLSGLRGTRVSGGISVARRSWAGTGSVGAPRCVEHAWQLRRAIHEHVPELTLGGWANPHADANAQVDFLGDDHFGGEFFLTQVVSHHDSPRVERFLEAFDRRRLTLPGVFGVFFYRSANPKTLDALRHFLPVPVEALRREFAEGATPEDVCARTIATLRAAGVRHVYVSNLPVARRGRRSRGLWS